MNPTCPQCNARLVNIEEGYVDKALEGVGLWRSNQVWFMSRCESGHMVGIKGAGGVVVSVDVLPEPEAKP